MDGTHPKDATLNECQHCSCFTIMLKEDGKVSPINVYPFATDFYGKYMRFN